jgi:hypothetical protein
MDDLLVDDQHGIRVGAADIDANTLHGVLSSSHGGREEGTVVEVVAEGAGTDEFETSGTGEHRRGRECHDGDALAVTDGLGADAVAVDAV